MKLSRVEVFTAEHETHAVIEDAKMVGCCGFIIGGLAVEIERTVLGQVMEQRFVPMTEVMFTNN